MAFGGYGTEEGDFGLEAAEILKWIAMTLNPTPQTLGPRLSLSRSSPKSLAAQPFG